MSNFTPEFIKFLKEEITIDIESDSRSYLKLNEDGSLEEVEYEKEFYAYSIVLQKEGVQTDWEPSDYWEVLEEMNEIFTSGGGEAVFKYIKDNFSIYQR